MPRRMLFAVLAGLLAAGAHAQGGLRLPAEAAAPKPAAAAEDERVLAVQGIFECLATGLPDGGWRRASAEVVEIAAGGEGRTFKGSFSYLPRAEGAEPADLVPCDSREAAARIYALNDFLEPEQRQWKAARLVFTSDGRFELDYDYGGTR